MWWGHLLGFRAGGDGNDDGGGGDGDGDGDGKGNCRVELNQFLAGGPKINILR